MTARRCAGPRPSRSRSAACRSRPGSRFRGCPTRRRAGVDDRPRTGRPEPRALIVVFAFGMAAPPGALPSVTVPQLRDAARASVDWFVRNQKFGGDWLYEYDKDTDDAGRVQPVRHAGVTMGLYQAAAAGLPGALRSADRGTEWALKRLLERDGWAALAAQPEVDTGATALLVAGLTIRREATGDTLRRGDAPARALSSRRLSRRARCWPATTRCAARRGGSYSKYFTGEAYWALARLGQRSPARAGARRQTALGRTSRPRATRRRATGRRSPTTGPPMGWPRRRSCASPGGRRSPGRGRLRTEAGRALRRAGALARAALRTGEGVRAGYEPRGGWWRDRRGAHRLVAGAGRRPRLASREAIEARHLRRRARR